MLRPKVFLFNFMFALFCLTATAGKGHAQATSKLPEIPAVQLDLNRAVEIGRLRQEYDQISLGRPITALVAGWTMLSIGIGTAVDAAADISDRCDGNSCQARSDIRAAGIAGGIVGAAGATLFGLGIARLKKRLRSRRQLRRRIEDLQHGVSLTGIGLDAGPKHAGLNFALSF